MKWYYLAHGQPQGPFATDQILKKISQAEIGPRDLLYREKDTAWQEAQSIKDFAAAFSLPTQESVEWTILIKKIDRSGYKQKGPLATSQVLAGLRSGELSYSDYIWRKGLKEWYKISALAEFKNPNVEPEKFVPQLPIEAPKIKDLSEKLFNGPSISTPAGMSSSPKENLKKVRPGAKRRTSQPKDLIRRIWWYQRLIEWPRFRKATVLLFIIFLLGAIFYFFTFVSSYRDQGRWSQQPEVVSPYVDSNLPPPVTQFEKQDPVSPLEPTSTPNVPTPPPSEPAIVEPTFVRVSIKDDGQDTAKMNLVTDGRGPWSVTWTIRSDGGRALSLKSLFKTVKLPLAKAKSIDFSMLGLPYGTYDLEVEILKTKGTSRIRYGTLQDNFGRKLTLFRKQLVYAHNLERNAFVKSASRLEGELREVLQGLSTNVEAQVWRAIYKNWRKGISRLMQQRYLNISSKNRRDYVHPILWSQLKEKYLTVEQLIGEINQNRQKGQPVNSSELRQKNQEISSLKLQMINTTLWRD